MSLRHAAFSILLCVPLVVGQNRPPGAPPPTPNDKLMSPEVGADRAVTFRLYAPKAEKVRVATEFKGSNSIDMTKAEDGVWSVTTPPIDAGAYRYTFNVDGVRTSDPKNPLVSESVGNTSSVVVVTGAAFMDASTDVPHGAVAAVYYKSTALNGRMRRMHIYTPPGYELGGREKYPVFYLLHGAGDNDDAWTSVGRANFILDNLIAAKKAKPMIVVMPAGHTSAARFTPGSADEFLNDFEKDIVPYVDAHYRVLTDRKDTALAGLSMGGAQTLNLMARLPEKFAYIGVFSSGIIVLRTGGGGFDPSGIYNWAKEHAEALDSPGAKKGLKLVWLSTGADDFLLQTTKSTVEMLDKRGFHPEYHESTGGHTWINWREYLDKFAPLLFQ
jgi:enterochelin esterase-like enzyme